MPGWSAGRLTPVAVSDDRTSRTLTSLSQRRSRPLSWGSVAVAGLARSKASTR